jgi:hypothetical protein
MVVGVKARRWDLEDARSVDGDVVVEAHVPVMESTRIGDRISEGTLHALCLKNHPNSILKLGGE